MTSMQSPAALLKDIHKKDAPYSLALIGPRRRLGTLGIQGRPTEARLLGRAAPDPAESCRWTRLPGHTGSERGLRFKVRLGPARPTRAGEPSDSGTRATRP